MGGKLGSNRAPWCSAVLLLCACTGGNGAPPAPVEDFDGGDTPIRDGGPRDGGNRDGGDSAADAAPSLGPLLELLDPAADSVVVGTTLTARCRVEKNPNGEAVNPSSVKVALYEGDNTMALVTQVATSTTEANVFKADVALAVAPHGALRIECSAADLSQQKQASSQNYEILVDRGPLITFLYPTENGYVPAGKGSGEDARIRFKVEPRVLHSDDDGADVGDIKVTVAGKEITGVEESGMDEFVYSFGVDFNDFSVIPDTLSVRVEASNVRDPAAVATSSLLVGVDSVGPTINVRSPVGVNGAEPILSGKIDVVLEVKDLLAGVDAASVEMAIKDASGRERRYATESMGNSLYTTSFEVGEYPDSSSLTLNFYAKDNVALETTAGLGIRIDDKPPWMSLEPGLVRELFPRIRPAVDQCSGPFNPLGDDAPFDGKKIQKAVQLRTIAWDRARVVSGQYTIAHYAMVDENSVDLVVQHDTDVPLLINSRGIPGGPCDAVNLRPGNGQAAPVVIELDPMVPQGVPPLAGTFDGNDFIEDLVSDPDASAVCGSSRSGGVDSEICRDPYMSRIIKHVVIGSYPAVYGINVNNPFCSGDYYSNPKPGPLCMVSQGRDKAGNVSFSWPMRLCSEFADGEDGDPVDNHDDLISCPDGVLDGITCTDGCVLPTNFGPNAVDRMPRILVVEL